MGWWWRSESAASTQQTSRDLASAPSTDTASSTEHSAPENATTASTEPARALTRDEKAFAELKGLLGSINPEAAARAATTAKAYAEAKLEFDDDSLYPSTMSCSQCFDMAYYCSSIGGQMNNVYRYGGLRSCSELWAQWRFCMRTKAMDKDTAKIRIREYNMKKVAKYKTGRSSEDIWRVRTSLPEDEPFMKDPDTAPEP